MGLVYLYLLSVGNKTSINVVVKRQFKVLALLVDINFALTILQQKGYLFESPSTLPEGTHSASFHIFNSQPGVRNIPSSSSW